MGSKGQMESLKNKIPHVSGAIACPAAGEREEWGNCVSLTQNAGELAGLAESQNTSCNK